MLCSIIDKTVHRLPERKVAIFPIVHVRSNNLSKPNVGYFFIHIFAPTCNKYVDRVSFMQGESKFDVCKNSFLQELKEGLNNVQAN